MTVDGAMVNFLVYYEMDEDLSRHVLGLDTYAPSGPANSWVLLAPVGAEEAAEASRTSAVAAPADDGHGKKRKKKGKNEPKKALSAYLCAALTAAAVIVSHRDRLRRLDIRPPLHPSAGTS